MAHIHRLEIDVKQSKPFASACQEAALSILHTADALRRHYGEVMAPFGVTSQQYNVLRIVRGAGKRGIPSQEIVERMIEHSPGVTRLLDRLEEKDLVARRRSSRDRRVVFCILTAQGAALLEKMEPYVREGEQKAMESMDSPSLRELTRLLSDVRGSLEESRSAA